MPLIVEDGTGLEEANSYVSLVDAQEIAAMRGITLSENETELTSQLVNAADRITSYEQYFTGRRVSGDQGLSFPRVGSFRYGSVISETSVPKELRLAQVKLAGLLQAGEEIWAVSVEGIKSEKIGPLAIEYSDSAAASVGNPELPEIEAVLKPLFAPLSMNFVVTR